MSMNDDAALPVSPNETAPSDRINVDLLSDADYAVHIDQVHAAIKARHGVADRVCGDCTACCTVMGVRELKKASYQACPHNCAKELWHLHVPPQKLPQVLLSVVARSRRGGRAPATRSPRFDFQPRRIERKTDHGRL